MSYYRTDIKKIDLISHADYRAAYVGANFLVFSDNDHQLVMASEDAKRLSELESLYRGVFSKYIPSFSSPTYIFSSTDPDDTRLLKEFLGLPEEMYETLELDRPIVDQIRFKDDLGPLKAEVYSEIADQYHSHPHTDDFKLYLIENGVYFIQEETRAFMSGRVDAPVFLDADKLPDSIRRLVDHCDSESLLIDFPSDELAEKKDIFSKFDSFSFTRRLLFFVDGVFDIEISDIDVSDEDEREYAGLIRKFFATIINMLFDSFSFERMNKVSVKLSFLTPVTIETDRSYEVCSSFGGEVYSLDGENFAFNSKDRDILLKNTRRVFEETSDRDAFSIYQRLNLPYQCYRYVRGETFSTPEEFIDALPFLDDISDSTIYLAPKRFDENYSYLSGEREHSQAFQRRLLSDEGVIYIYQGNLLSYDPSIPLTIKVLSQKRDGDLAKLLDEDSSLIDIFASYETENLSVNNNLLFESIKKLDEISEKKALSTFFTCFNSSTLEEAMRSLLRRFACEDLYSESLSSFFCYVLSVPFKIVENRYRNHLVRDKDHTSLLAIDGYRSDEESFEPNLIYPYVSYGQNYYTFRKKYSSEPYLCSCQKESIMTTINYFTAAFESNVAKKYRLRDLNTYLLMFLGLPKSLIRTIDLDKKLAPQLKFADHICHLCQNTTPRIYDSILEKSYLQINAYSTYARSMSAQNGVFQGDRTLTGHYFDENSYKVLLAFDRDKVRPYFLPYTDLSRTNLLAMLAAFSTEIFMSQPFLESLNAFLELSDQDIFRTLSAETFIETSRSFYICKPVFSELAYILDEAKNAYMIELIKEKFPYLSCDYGLNMDYNENLPLPCIYLGRVFNAYAPPFDTEEIYLCECERETIRDFLNRYSMLVSHADIADIAKTPLILGMTGLPFELISRYAKVDLSDPEHIDLFMDELRFRDDICRRCSGHAHVAYERPFHQVYPFKEDMRAERAFAMNGLAREGVSFITPLPLGDIVYDKDHIYDLSSTFDPLLPLIISSDQDGLGTFFYQLLFDEEKLKSVLYDFSLRSGSTGIGSLMNQIIISAHHDDPYIFIRYFNEEPSSDTLRDGLINHFPSLREVEVDLVRDQICEILLGFLTYLLERLITRQAEKEKSIGA